MSKHKISLRTGALHSLRWARKFRDSGDMEYFAVSIASFRMWRQESKDAA